MIEINMCITHCMRKRPWYELTDMCKHMCQQSVRSNIEWDPKTHIAGALIKLTM